jgi:hypothetical protein
MMAIFKGFGFVACQRVAHLQRRGKLGSPVLKQLVQILARMLLAGEKQRHQVLAHLC